MENNSQTPEKETLSRIIFETSQLVQELVENGGEITQRIMKSMEQKNIQLAGKLDAYGHVWERLEMEEAHWKQKADEFSRVAKSCKRVRENLKDRMKYGITAMEKTELAGNEFRFKLAKTSGKLVIENEKLIPSDFKNQVIAWEVKKDELKKALTDGQTVPGVKLVKEPSLRKYVNRK